MPSFPGHLKYLARLGLAAALASAGLTGCLGSRDDSDYNEPTTPKLDAVAKQVGIDTGATLNASAGDGVGLFVEYAGAGKWSIWTTCDTNLSQNTCNFDAFVTVPDEATLSNLVGTGLEGADFVAMADDHTAHLFAQTSTGKDGMTFETTAGSTVELTVYLDGISQPRFVYWTGDTVLHEGAPSNPIDFAPSSQ